VQEAGTSSWDGLLEVASALLAAAAAGAATDSVRPYDALDVTAGSGVQLIGCTIQCIETRASFKRRDTRSVRCRHGITGVSVVTVHAVKTLLGGTS
jgi:hypothetical protein